MVGAADRQTAYSQIGATDGFDLFNPKLFGCFVQGHNQVPKHTQGSGFPSFAAEFLQAYKLGEDDRHIGELLAGTLVAVSTLGDGRGWQDAPEEFFVLSDLMLEFFCLQLDTTSHAVEDCTELPKFVFGGHRNLDVGISSPEATSTLDQLLERFDQPIGE